MRYRAADPEKAHRLAPRDRYRLALGATWKKSRQVRGVIDGTQIVARIWRGKHYGWHYEILPVSQYQAYARRGMVQVNRAGLARGDG